jgi:hypothetical protein
LRSCPTYPVWRQPGQVRLNFASILYRGVSAMPGYPAFDTRPTLTYNIPRSLWPMRSDAIGFSAEACNHYERSVNLSATTTKTQVIQRAAQSPAQPRCLEASASCGLSTMSRDAAAPPGLSFMRHLSRRQGNRSQSQKEILLDHSIEVRLFPGRASGFVCTALIVSSGDCHLT